MTCSPSSTQRPALRRSREDATSRAACLRRGLSRELTRGIASSRSVQKRQAWLPSRLHSRCDTHYCHCAGETVLEEKAAARSTKGLTGGIGAPLAGCRRTGRRVLRQLKKYFVVPNHA